MMEFWVGLVIGLVLGTCGFLYLGFLGVWGWLYSKNENRLARRAKRDQG